MTEPFSAARNKMALANRNTGAERKAKSLQQIQTACELLKYKSIKPTIMQVVELLKGHLGETTIKKYWRIINPKTTAVTNAVPEIPNECNGIKKQFDNSDDKLCNQSPNKSQVVDENFVELHVPEWNLTIYKPRYFELLYKINSESAIVKYQNQFFPFAKPFTDYYSHARHVKFIGL